MDGNRLLDHVQHLHGNLMPDHNFVHLPSTANTVNMDGNRLLDHVQHLHGNLMPDDNFVHLPSTANTESQVSASRWVARTRLDTGLAGHFASLLSNADATARTPTTLSNDVLHPTYSSLAKSLFFNKLPAAIAAATHGFLSETERLCFSLRYLPNKPDIPITKRWSSRFPENGHGTVIFNCFRSSPFSIVIRPATEMHSACLALEVGETAVQLLVERRSGREILSTEKDKDSGCTGSAELTAEKRLCKVGFEPGYKVAYWLSYDRDNLVIKYGKGYRMEETVIIKYDFLAGLTTEEDREAKREELTDLFDPSVPRLVEFYDREEVTKTPTGDSTDAQANDTSAEPGESSNPYYKKEQSTFEASPFMGDWPAVVVDSAEASILDMDSGLVMLSASLPSECRVLYRNVANLKLEHPGDPEGDTLWPAIGYSINTKGCILYEKLKEKAGEFGSDDMLMTYLRIGLGDKHGNSPGKPYVLEIWPSKHFSPVHDHGNTYAVIKVLYGEIKINIYNKHAIAVPRAENEEIPKLKAFSARTDEITWISPTFNQIHKLHNVSEDFCATIQAYKYGDDDYAHWPYFDFEMPNEDIGNFLPFSDFTYTEMCEQVLKEYATKK